LASGAWSRAGDQHQAHPDILVRGNALGHRLLQTRGRRQERLQTALLTGRTGNDRAGETKQGIASAREAALRACAKMLDISLPARKGSHYRLCHVRQIDKRLNGLRSCSKSVADVTTSFNWVEHRRLSWEFLCCKCSMSVAICSGRN
jgi:hypothetical protein